MPLTKLYYCAISNRYWLRHETANKETVWPENNQHWTPAPTQWQPTNINQ